MLLSRRLAVLINASDVQEGRAPLGRITLGTMCMRVVFLAMVLGACAMPVVLWGQATAAEKAPAAKSSSSSVGEWAAPVNFCTYPCLVGANAAVMNNGNVLFYYYPAANTYNSQAMVLNPITGALTNVALPVSDDIFCSGITILQSGTVMATGGNIEGVKCSHDASGCGTTNTLLFNPTTSTWTVGEPMINARWYPSTVELGSGTDLEIAGTNSTGAWVQTQLEYYASGWWTALPSSANLPSALAQVYPRLTLLSSGNVFVSSPSAQSYQFNPTTNKWAFVAPVNFGYRYFAPHVLLPGGTKIMVAGGSLWSVMASQTIQRTYHSTAVLIPDGRVVSAGSDNGAATQVTYEIYSPPYLFNGARPVIKSAPTSLTYGSSFKITTANASTIASVALVRPGATTHADDFDQRYVNLTFTIGSGTITATAPANGNIAPPGYYMLVIVNSSGVPSVMTFLNLN
jgi:hypothetical protein